MQYHKRIFLYLSLLFLFPVTAWCQFGIPDNSFDSDGEVITDVSGFADHVNDIIIQQDGKILICGYSDFYDPDGENFVLIPEAARYTGDGTLDAGFADNGLLLLTQGMYANSYFNSVVQQTDGKLVYFGNRHSDFVAVRTNADGETDESFGSDATGNVTIDVAGSDDFSHSMIQQADGKLVCVGQSVVGFDILPVILRMMADGSFDNSFADSGVAIPFESYVTNFIDVKEQTDGKLVVGGYRIDSTTGYHDFYLTRFTADGKVDSTFGKNGRVMLDFYGGSDQFITRIALQDDGKIVAVGKVYTLNSDACIARFNADGSIDSTFSEDGKAVFDWGIDFSSAQSCAIQSDGKIVLTGYRSDGAVEESLVMMRLETNGAPDNTFGSAGIVLNNFNDIAFGRCVAIQPDNKLIAAGGNGDDACLARYNSGLETGITSPSSASFLLRAFPNPATTHTILSCSFPHATSVEVALCDNLGRKLAVLFAGTESAGMRQLDLSIPENIPSGSYFCRLSADNLSAVAPLVIAR
jgi:uncharacterized delta-60 repeat protein